MSLTSRRARSTAAVALAALLAPMGALVIAPSAHAAGDVGAVADPGDTVSVDFPYRAEAYEWVVPEGVTEISIELAAGSGADRRGMDRDVAGGPGGWLTAGVAVVPGETLSLILGRTGESTVPDTGGLASVLARPAQVIAVAGGGGGAVLCQSALDSCAPGGAGGFSATASGADGKSSQWQTEPEVSISALGAGATPDGPGAPSIAEAVVISSTGDVSRDVVGTSAAPAGTPVQVDAAGLIERSRPGSAGDDFAGDGGGGYYSGSGGSTTELVDLRIEGGADLVFRFRGGGGGGSGYLVEGAEIVELRDNAGNGFAAISYVVPEPTLVDDTPTDPEPQLIDTNEPTLTVSAATVRAGASLELSGTGLDPDRTYPVILNSDPVLLGEVTTDARGAFTTTVTIPASVHPGEHVISVGEASIPITVLAADAAPAPQEAAPQPELAATGTADDLGVAGLAALTLLGLGTLVLRRVRESEHVE